MLHRLRPKLTYANVVASLALFIALGGSAYAIGAGAIGSREIRDNSIRSRDVRNNALTGRDINERTLLSAPRVYHRSKITPVTLTSVGVSDSVSGNPGDTAIFGKEGADGNQLSFHTGGNLQGKVTYRGTVYGEPEAAGQRRNLILTIACLARARR